MNCTNCAAPLSAAEKFCRNCGTPVPEPGIPGPATLPLMGLHVTAGPGVGRSVQLAEVTRIGRGVDNEFRLYDPEVSRDHAAIYRYEQGFAVSDLGSANGTFVNGARIAEAAWIRPGDEIRVGTVHMQVTAPGVPVVKRPAPSASGGDSRRTALAQSGDGGLPVWLLWSLLGFGMLLAAAGVVGLIYIL